MLAKAGLDFAQGNVGLGLDQRQDRRGVRLDPTRPPISTERPRTRLTLLARQTTPPTDARCTDTEPLARFSVRGASFDRGQHANSQIQRQRFRHVCRPPIRQTA
jgi:hypothetical protein